MQFMFSRMQRFKQIIRFPYPPIRILKGRLIFFTNHELQISWHPLQTLQHKGAVMPLAAGVAVYTPYTPIQSPRVSSHYNVLNSKVLSADQ